MSKKQEIFDEMLRIVVECCTLDLGDGNHTITKEDVLSKKSTSSLNMTRCIVVTQMLFLGFSRDTIAKVLGRTEKTIGDMLSRAHDYRIQSFAYRQAEAESTIKMKEIMHLM